MSYLFTAADSDALTYETGSDLTLVTIGNSLTIMCWLRKSTNAGVNGMGVFGLGNVGTVVGRFATSVASGEELTSSVTSGTSVSSTGVTSSTNTWYLHAGVFVASTGDNYTVQTYNGTVGGSATAYTTSATKDMTTYWPTDIYVGRAASNSGPTYNFDGYIAHCAVFNKALSQSELDDLCSKTPDACSAAANLVAYWPLQNDTNDAVGNLDLSITSGSPVVDSENPALTGGASVTSVSSGGTFENGESVTITGTGFGASQGQGTVKISPTDNVNDASAVSQTVTAWSDTSITITVVRNDLLYYTGMYLFVTSNTGPVNTSGYSVQFVLNPVKLVRTWA